MFISYAREDRETALRLRESLLSLGADVWLDVTELLPGQDWQTAITVTLRKSSHVVVLVSEASVNKTGYVQKEVRAALDRLTEFPPDAVFVIPVRLDKSQPKHDALTRLHWVDLFPNYGYAVQQIAKSLGLSEPVLQVARVDAPTPRVDTEIRPRLVVEGFFTPNTTDSTPQGACTCAILVGRHTTYALRPSAHSRAG